MPCCFLISRHGFSEAFSVLSPGFAGCDAQTRPNATEGASRSQCEVQIEALSCKTLCFYRFWMQRLTLKITPTQVQKRSPFGLARPCWLLGSFFGAKPSFLEVLDATFDTEDHPNAGPKTVSLGSPGHAVSPFRGPASGKLFRC